MADSKGLEEVPEGMLKDTKTRQQESFWQWLDCSASFCAVGSFCDSVEQNTDIAAF